VSPTSPPSTTAATAPQRSLVHHPDFRRLWTGDALGQLGAQLTGLALPVYAVQHLAATPWQMGALGAAETAAFLLIGLPAGAWVDRMRKRRVLVLADLVRALVLGVVVTAAATGHASMALLVVAALLVGGASVFFDVAHQSYVPGLVGREHLVEGNSKLQATQSIAAVAAPAIGGAMLRVITAPVLIGVNAVTYVVSAFAVSRIRHSEQLPDAATRRPLRVEVAEGLSFVLRQPLMRRLLLAVALINLFGALWTSLGMLYMLRVLGLDVGQVGIVASASAIGGIAAAVLVARLSRALGEGPIIPIAALAFIPAAALTPLASHAGDAAMVVLVAGGALMYFAVVVFNVGQVSFRQTLCPPELLGRVNASVRFVAWGVIPVGGLLAGWLGTHIGVVPTLWVSVGGAALSTLPVVISPLWRMRELPRYEPAP